MISMILVSFEAFISRLMHRNLTMLLLESSPSRRKKICPTVDLTNEGGLVNMARGLKIGNGCRSFHWYPLGFLFGYLLTLSVPDYL